jgi:hypothetical protein
MVPFGVTVVGASLPFAPALCGAYAQPARARLRGLSRRRHSDRPLPDAEGTRRRFTDRADKVAPEHRRLDRDSTLDLDAICELPVASVLADNVHL